MWIAADYTFKKQLQIEIEHHADIHNVEDTSELCLLKNCCIKDNTHHHDFHMTIWNHQYSFNDTVCTLFTDHFCSYCFAKTSDLIPDRIVAYHYLPEDYKTADTFRAELAFCYDLEICKKVTSG